MFSDSSIFNPISASAASDPLSDSIAESALFHTLFAMPAPINTIQDFCLFDADESSFDYPLFTGPTNVKSKSSVQNNPLNYFNNPLCTPQTPSLDLVTRSAVPAGDLGFDSCSAFLEDSAVTHHLMDTPFTPYLDTPSLIDTPLETPFLSDFGLDTDMDVNLDSNSPFPLFSDFGFNFAYTIEPNMLLPIDQPKASDLTLASPAMSILSSPVEANYSDEEEDDEDFVDSRSAALVSGLKRKTTDSASPIKKSRSSDLNGSKKAIATKRFSCSQPGCDRRFARLFNLHTHEKTHDPVQARPFTCTDTECGKSFSRKHDLQRHEASVHKGERNFACTNCHKPFSRQDGLRRHLAVKGPCSDNAWLAT